MRGQKSIILNPTHLPDGMLLRRVVCDDRGLPMQESYLDYWDGADIYIPDVVKVPKGMVGVEDGRYLGIDHSISCTITYREMVGDFDCLFPNIGVYTIHKGESCQIGEGEGLVKDW